VTALDQMCLHARYLPKPLLPIFTNPCSLHVLNGPFRRIEQKHTNFTDLFMSQNETHEMYTEHFLSQNRVPGIEKKTNDGAKFKHDMDQRPDAMVITVVTLLLYCWYTVVTSLLHCTQTVVTFSSHCHDPLFATCADDMNQRPNAMVTIKFILIDNFGSSLYNLCILCFSRSYHVYSWQLCSNDMEMDLQSCCSGVTVL
jgi:hypothetical protein